MRLFATEHVFGYRLAQGGALTGRRHPWEQVSVANWIKYPNDDTPHVLHVDYLSRRVDAQTGRLHTERLLSCRQNVPSFVSRILGGDDSSFFYEKSEVDPQGRTLTLRSRNLTFCNMIMVEETCRYQTDAHDPARTVFTQEASVTSFTGWSHIRDAIEEFCVGRFCVNAKKGRQALENAIERLCAGTKEQVRETLSLFDKPAVAAAGAAPPIEGGADS